MLLRWVLFSNSIFVFVLILEFVDKQISQQHGWRNDLGMFLLGNRSDQTAHETAMLVQFEDLGMKGNAKTDSYNGIMYTGATGACWTANHDAENPRCLQSC